MKNFYELFIHELKDIFDAENQILKALPDMIHAASSPELKEGLRHHLEETKKQYERLLEIGVILDENLAGGSCEGMKGLLKEGHKILMGTYQSNVKDAALIGAAQRVEHYEIAVYGALIAYAKHLNFDVVETLLKESIKEEGNADKKLTSIAEGGIFTAGVNDKACKKKSA